MAYRLTGNHADAQDLAQDVLLRARKGLETFRPGSMEAWLSRIATNAFLDDMRRRRRRPTESWDDRAERLAELPSPRDVESEIAAGSLSEELQQALLRLPEEFRLAVVLCDVVGLTYEEIAEKLDVAVGTVRSRIHRGRTALRKALT